MNDRRLDRVPFVWHCTAESHARLAGKLPELDRAQADLRTALQRVEGGRTQWSRAAS